MSGGCPAVVAHGFPSGVDGEPGPVVIYHCPPAFAVEIARLLARWGLVDVSGSSPTASVGWRGDVDEEESLVMAAEVGPALERLECSFGIFLPSVGEVDGYCWLYTPTLGRFESRASNDGATVLVAAEALDAVVGSSPTYEALASAIDRLSGRAHRRALAALAAPRRRT